MLCDDLATQRLSRHSQHLLKLLDTLAGCTDKPPAAAPHRRSQPTSSSQERGRRSYIRFSLGDAVPTVAHGQAEFSDSGELTRVNALIVRRGLKQDYHERVSVDVSEQHRRLLLTTSVHESQRSYFAGTWTLTENRQTGAVEYEYQGPQRLGLGSFARASLSPGSR